MLSTILLTMILGIGTLPTGFVFCNHQPQVSHTVYGTTVHTLAPSSKDIPIGYAAYVVHMGAPESLCLIRVSAPQTLNNSPGGEMILRYQQYGILEHITDDAWYFFTPENAEETK
jgi:hypothetical protein